MAKPSHADIFRQAVERAQETLRQQLDYFWGEMEPHRGRSGARSRPTTEGIVTSAVNDLLPFIGGPNAGQR